MCPLCDKRCAYWILDASCNYSRATYLFDNYATVAFAIVMALWASFFQEFWKRKQAELEYEWDVEAFEMEEVRLWQYSDSKLIYYFMTQHVIAMQPIKLFNR